MTRKLHGSHLGYEENSSTLIYVISDDGKDFYLRYNGINLVVDIRSSSNGADYTTWGLDELWSMYRCTKNYFNRLMSFETLMRITDSRLKLGIERD